MKKYVAIWDNMEGYRDEIEFDNLPDAEYEVDFLIKSGRFLFADVEERIYE